MLTSLASCVRRSLSIEIGEQVTSCCSPVGSAGKSRREIHWITWLLGLLIAIATAVVATPATASAAAGAWASTPTTSACCPTYAYATAASAVSATSTIRRSIYGSAAEDAATTIGDSQFGAKIGQHAGDFGLDASDPAARSYLRNLITDIRGNADEVRIGPWRGGGENYQFFRKGADVVVTKPDGSFVTILNGGENNGFYQGATPR